jgi:hypothetical protein
VVLLLTAAAHTMAHLSGPAEPQSAEQGEMLRLMQSVPIDTFGVKRTMMQIVDGFSWLFSASFVLLGVLGISLWWTRRGDGGLMRLVAGFYAVFLAGMTAMSYFLFPPPPTAFFAAAGLLFLIASAGG